MYSIIMDTSTKYLYLCLLKDQEIVEERMIEGMKNHAGMSVYTINEMLEAHQLSCDDLASVYCGYGPGSYTGVRISVTIAKMLASFKDIKLYAVSSLYLAGSGYDNTNVSVMFDARRGNVFSANYGTVQIADKLRSKEEFMKETENLKDVFYVTEENFKVNPLKVISHGILVNEIEAFVPNYLRISEAEYNLEHKND